MYSFFTKIVDNKMQLAKISGTAVNLKKTIKNMLKTNKILKK